jgi:hypothetical protein
MKKIFAKHDLGNFERKNKKLIKDVYEMQHCYRINGIVDIYKHGFCVYDKVNNLYHKFDKIADVCSMALKLLSTNEPQEVFSSVNKSSGKISYKAFKQRMAVADWRPEEDHWKTHKDKVSEDHLYFATDGMNRVKIGRSNNPWKRIKTMNTGNASDVQLLCVVKNKGCLEKNFHSCFSKLNITREWFSYTSRIDDFINHIKNNKNGCRVYIYQYGR